MPIKCKPFLYVTRHHNETIQLSSKRNTKLSCDTVDVIVALWWASDKSCLLTTNILKYVCTSSELVLTRREHGWKSRRAHEGATHKTITPWNINDYPINLTWNELSYSHDDSYWYRISYSKEATLLMLKEMDYCDLWDCSLRWRAAIVSWLYRNPFIWVKINRLKLRKRITIITFV